MSTSTYCYKHSTRETTLRCNKCDNYICPSCAVHTPTGYTCKDCIRNRNREFTKAYTSTTWYDYLVAPVVAGFLGYFGTLIALEIGFFVILLGWFGGIYIARAVQWAVKRRRSKSLPVVATAALIIGGLLTEAPALSFFFLTGDFIYLRYLLWPAVFIILAAVTTYTNLVGIRNRR